jgi:large subunit ribosomal protein L5
MSELRRPKIEKVVVNMGVGESGKKLSNALMILERLTQQKPVRTIAKKTVFGARRGEPIGCMVTLRRKRADEFLKRALSIKGRLPASSFDEFGNFSFGIDDHTDFGIKYDPEIGILGMDVCVSLGRPGYRIAHRRRAKKKIPGKHRLTKEEAISFISERYGVEVV